MTHCDLLALHGVTNFLTGSEAFGLSKGCEYSDYDICILDTDFEKAKEIIHQYYTVTHISQSTYSRGEVLCVRTNPYSGQDTEMLNLIPLTVQQFLSWYFATKTLMNFHKKHLEDKNNRIRIFETLVAISRDMFGYESFSFGGGSIEQIHQGVKQFIKSTTQKMDKQIPNLIVV
jgi:hypothetical protein